ncbi:MAG: ABC transporter permease subunit [Candidatus Marinimicrobia bacterium]|jgi:microcin C transport system permease protein|nr:ABC transporter permease subunit [Candidatus Neomarinimicrobiota bacterium]MDP6852488.1 ABC transporter permease subunit [Candidatus Neomarinimicrobiota bacterium]MDP6936576.1 ABC transporter permease subunit [Candidatus Neomarinimicrobiota bacterium]
MATYFLRRLLLIIPTFLGSTILVFTILQLAPGGPLERTIQQLQSGGMGEMAVEGGGGSGSITGGSILPESAMKELKRFYGFDKPIWQRYLAWLGVWPRGIKHRDFSFDSEEYQIEKRVGKRSGQIWRVDIHRDGEDFTVYEKDGTISEVWEAKLEEKNEDGSIDGVIFQTEFSGVLTGNLGKSYTFAKPVTEIMKPRFRISLFFGLIGYFLTYAICIPLGIRKALNHGSPFDFISSVIIFIAYSIPGWALGGVFLVLLGGGSFWDIFPLGGFHAPTEIWEQMTLWEKIVNQAHHAVLPIISWFITSFATLTVLMKNSLLENLSQDYIRTAFAKGIAEKRVVWVHAFRNSIIPIASGIGHIIAIVITGSYLIERVFNIDGFGRMGFQAILDRDYPVTMGFLVIVVLIRLLGNIISDFALATVDPRIRFK